MPYKTENFVLHSVKGAAHISRSKWPDWWSAIKIIRKDLKQSIVTISDKSSVEQQVCVLHISACS